MNWILSHSVILGRDNTVKRLILHYFAQKGGDKEVTKEESDAIWLAFMRLMEEKLDEETN